jgi:selenium metabolism protein YedF
MSKLVDCRGLSCPQPVVQTKQALDESDNITIIVDNPTSRSNVVRFAESQGCKVTVDEREEGSYIHILKGKGEGSESKVTPFSSPGAGPIVVVIPNDQMGRGEQELGNILIRAFLHTLTDASPRPDTMIFFNTGVRLTVEGSDVLDDLQSLEKKEVEILVCGTCLDYFKLKDKIAVGHISNMYTITEIMLSASRLVTV